MHILLSNDDGVWAKGLCDLAVELAKTHRVTIVAPELEQSAKSHALTIHTPVRLRKFSEPGDNPMRYAITGTPTDCVKFALSYFLVDDMPDLVISGVNNGFNLGSDALYSGTVGAAMEALIFNVPALAVSVERYNKERSAEITPFINEFVTEIFGRRKYHGLLNMNFAKEGPVGWANTEILNQGLQIYRDIIDAREDRRGHKYYWIGGKLAFEPEAVPTDVAEIKNGKITVVALDWRQQDATGTAVMSDMLKAIKG